MTSNHVVGSMLVASQVISSAKKLYKDIGYLLKLSAEYGAQNLTECISKRISHSDEITIICSE